MSFDNFYPLFPQNCVSWELVHCYTRGEQCILKALVVGSPCPLLFGLLASSAIFCVVFVSLQPRLRHNRSQVVLWPRDLNTNFHTKTQILQAHKIVNFQWNCLKIEKWILQTMIIPKQKKIRVICTLTCLDNIKCESTSTLRSWAAGIGNLI